MPIEAQRLDICREQAIIKVFDQNTYSVVNVFDLTLQVGPSALHCVHKALFV